MWFPCFLIPIIVLGLFLLRKSPRPLGGAPIFGADPALVAAWNADTPQFRGMVKNTGTEPIAGLYAVIYGERPTYEAGFASGSETVKQYGGWDRSDGITGKKLTFSLARTC